MNSKVASITTNMIKDTYIDSDSNNKKYVVIKLKKDYYNVLKRLTRNNVDRTLAVVIDNNVYSIQKQTGGIENGKIILTGNYNYSKDELNVITSLLKHGELSVVPKIIKIEIKK